MVLQESQDQEPQEGMVQAQIDDLGMASHTEMVEEEMGVLEKVVGQSGSGLGMDLDSELDSDLDADFDYDFDLVENFEVVLLVEFGTDFLVSNLIVMAGQWQTLVCAYSERMSARI